jgi:ATP-binding protein involved in chromosome partitioning
MTIESQIKNSLEDIIFRDGSSMASRISGIVHNKGDVGFALDISNLSREEGEEKRLKAIDILNHMDNIAKISIVLTSSKKAEDQTKKDKIHIEGVKYVLAIAAGKGGVGKSTISSLLAEMLAIKGQKVGIIDADIYGPSIPQIFNLTGKPKIDDKKMIPLISRGIEINSIGFLTSPGAAVSWRGPMVSKALYQLLSLTKWNNLDFLIVDLPPGTGDIHLSFLQNYIINSVIMVTTPQKISEIDVCRAINLYQKFNINILGLIENMSYFIEPTTNQKLCLLHGNAAQTIANTYKLPILAELPLEPGLAKACDEGRSLSKYTDLVSSIYQKLINHLLY